MIKNRIFALVYRVCAFGVSLYGVAVGSGFNKGPKRFLFYTNQTNLLVCILFLVLSIRTAVDLMKNGAKGSACYYPRFCHACALCIGYTLAVFWCALAPFAASRGLKLLSLGNIVTHTLTPLLAIFNCILLCERGRIKRRDILLWPLMPLAYILSSYALTLLGVTFYVLDGAGQHYPYYFMDFSALGLYALAFLVVLASSFTLSAFLIYRLDRRRGRTAKQTLEA